MGKTRERAWRGADERKRNLRYINERKRKVKQAHKLLDDDDVVILDPKRQRCDLVQNMSDSLLDDNDGSCGGDGDGDGDGVGGGDDDGVELLDSKQSQCELVDDDDNDDGGGGGGDDDDVEILDPKQKQCELVVDDGGGDDDSDHVDLLDPEQEQHKLVEDMSPISLSPFMPEKQSSFQSGIVYVRGYKVKQSVATILETIFKKHGDIAANCVFEASSTRAHFLEVVCEIVRQIQTNDMTEVVKDNIESQLSDAEGAKINVSWIREHFEAFHKRNESGKKFSLLMELKSNTMLVKAAAQTDLRERCEELMGAQQRFEKAEKCVRVLHLVEKNLNDNIMESKAEMDSWVKHPVV